MTVRSASFCWEARANYEIIDGFLKLRDDVSLDFEASRRP